MTKPSNFPERKRQRQLGALKRLSPVSKKGKDNSPQFLALHVATAGGTARDTRTKKLMATASAARQSRRKFKRGFN